MPFKQEHCRIETNEQNVTVKYPINKWKDFETKNSLTPEQTFFFFPFSTASVSMETVFSPPSASPVHGRCALTIQKTG